MADASKPCTIIFQPRIFVLFVLLGLVNDCVCPGAPYRATNEPEGLKYVFLKLNDPHADPDHMVVMGDRLRSVERHEDAKKFYRKAVKKYTYRAKYDVDYRELHKALSDYKTVVTLEQQYLQDENKLYDLTEVSSSVAKLAERLFERGLHTDSQWCFETALKIHPGNPVTYSKRGMCYWKSGDTDSALADLMKSLELGPEYTDGRAKWYTMLIEAGKSDEAEAVFANIEPAKRRALLDAEVREEVRKKRDEEEKRAEHDPRRRHGRHRGSSMWGRRDPYDSDSFGRDRYDEDYYHYMEDMMDRMDVDSPESME